MGLVQSGVMSRYRCSCFGEWNWYNAWSIEKVEVRLFWGMGLVQCVEY